MSKICNNCGRNVDDGAKFCPYCKCNTFRDAYELTAPKDDLIHKIFYWSYPQGSMLSKSKIAAISVFLYFTLFFILSTGNPITIVVAFIFALVTLLVGLVIHKIKGMPPIKKIRYNDYGLVEDLKHLLFFWQTRSGGFILSKTKILSFAIFLIGVGIGLFSLNYMVAFGAIFIGLIIEVPTFAIGFAIHKLTNDDADVKPELPKRPKKEIAKKKGIKETPKVETTATKAKIIPQYLDYQIQLDDLNKQFISKEKSTRDLIAKRFEPPQLTYTRFITGVDKSSQLFKKHRDSAFTMISLADEYSPRIASEVETKIEILKEILDKLDSLSNELIVSDNLTTKDDVDDLIGEMDDLIESVKDYE